MKPSLSQIDAYQKTFDYFNDHIFNGQLPQCLLNFSRLGRKSVAFYVNELWENEDRIKLDEISLNPNFLYLSVKEITSSLVHEMCHLWQFKYGKPSRRGYHNKQWAAKMIEVGLMPVGKNGKQTGQSMSDEIIPGGAFENVFNQMPESYKLPWRVFLDVEDDEESEDKDDRKKKSGARIKYSCPGCLTNVWGKSELLIACGFCKVLFVESEQL